MVETQTAYARRPISPGVRVAVREKDVVYIPVYEMYTPFGDKIDTYFSTAYRTLFEASRELRAEGYEQISYTNRNSWVLQSNPLRKAFIKKIEITDSL